MSTPASPVVTTVEVADGNVGVSPETAPAPKPESVTGGSDGGDFVEVKSPVQPPAAALNAAVETVEVLSEPVQEVEETTTRSANEEDQKASKVATVEDYKEEDDTNQAQSEGSVASSPIISVREAKKTFEAENTNPPEQGSTSKTIKAQKAPEEDTDCRPRSAHPSGSRQRIHARDDDDAPRTYYHDPIEGRTMEIPNLVNSNGQLATALVEAFENGRWVLKPIYDGSVSIVDIPTFAPVDRMNHMRGAGSSNQNPDIRLKVTMTCAEGSESTSESGDEHPRYCGSIPNGGSINIAPVEQQPRSGFISHGGAVNIPTPAQAELRKAGGRVNLPPIQTETHSEGPVRPPYPQTHPILSVPLPKQVRIAEEPTVLGGPYPAPPGSGNGNGAPGLDGIYNNSTGRPFVDRQAPLGFGIQAPPADMSNPTLPPPPVPAHLSSNDLRFPHGRPFVSGIDEPGLAPIPQSPIHSSGVSPKIPFAGNQRLPGTGMFGQPPFGPAPMFHTLPTPGPTGFENDYPWINRMTLIENRWAQLCDYQQNFNRDACGRMLAIIAEQNRTLTSMSDTLVRQNRDTQNALHDSQKMCMELLRRENRARESAGSGTHNYTVQNLHQYNGPALKSAPTPSNRYDAWDFHEYSREDPYRPRRTVRTYGRFSD